MDTLIKVLTVIKLSIEIALWGIMLGLTIYLLKNNPLPKLVAAIEQQAIQGALGGQKK